MSESVTLREHFLALLAASELRTADRLASQDKATATALAAAEKAVNAALAAQEKAVSLAEANSALWRASANEWRGAMTDREGQFVKTAELMSANAQIKEIKESLASTQGRGQGRGDMWGYVIGAVGLIATVAAIVGMVLK